MTHRTPHVLSSKTVTTPTGLYRLNRYELFDIMAFLDRGSLHSLTLVAFKFGAQLERWPDDACLIPKAELCIEKPDKALKLMQHALHVSAAETVSLNFKPTLPIAWFNIFNDVNVRQAKAGRIDRLVVTTDFSAVHPTVFERLPFLSGEITTIDLRESTGISDRHLTDVFFRRCIGRGVRYVEVPGTKYDLEKGYDEGTRNAVDFKKTCAPEKRKSMQARLSINDQRRLSKAPEIVHLVEDMNRRVSEFAL
ncbi:hypothetical protein AAVH_17886 [Aphelenchoides avenae]|nr:hypothetical protein AAVH_17886 [Aphelenchus avenae]